MDVCHPRFTLLSPLTLIVGVLAEAGLGRVTFWVSSAVDVDANVLG